MKKVLIAIAFMSASAVASPALVYYPQAQGVQAIYDNVYVGYSAKGIDETTTTARGCGGSVCTDVERDWFNYNVQVGAVSYTDYGVYPFAGLTYSKRNSHEDKFKDGILQQQYDHSDNSVGFEAGIMYEFYPHAIAALKFTTEYEEVQFGLGFRF